MNAAVFGVRVSVTVTYSTAMQDESLSMLKKEGQHGESECRLHVAYKHASIGTVGISRKQTLSGLHKLFLGRRP